MNRAFVNIFDEFNHLQKLDATPSKLKLRNGSQRFRSEASWQRKKKRIADYFVVAGLPKERPQLLADSNLEVSLKNSSYQDPITDITVIFPRLGETVPDHYQMVEVTPCGHCANLNHGSFRANDVYLCYRRGRHVQPLIEIGVFYRGKDQPLPDTQILESTYLTYKRATENSPSNELVVMDICVILASKGEVPPHSFMKIDKTLNKGIMSSDVYICYKKSINQTDLISYKPAVLAQYPFKTNSEEEKNANNDECSFKMDDNVALFCLPMGANLECLPANRALPFCHDLKILFISYKLRKNIRNGQNEVPLERYIHQFLYELPFPSPTRPRILYQLNAECRIPFLQPEELPLPRSGASFGNLLVSLGPDNCLLVLLLALTEQKILLHSFRPDVLTSVAEALKQIIFPFHWQCPYIPLCPIGMSDYLAAPLPFIIGLDSRFFDMYDQPSDVNAVDLDTKTITLSSPLLSEKLLPKRAARTLRASLVILFEKCNDNEANAIKLEAQNDGELDFEFIIKRREILLELEIPPTIGATDVTNLFHSAAFIKSRDHYYHKFYHLLMKTQMFTKFIEERSFVSDLDDVESVRTVYILPPDASDLLHGQNYDYDKIENLNSDLFYGTKKKTKRTKQEIRSAQKSAQIVHQKPYLWAKCLINTSYSLWFIHLPSYVLHESGRKTSLKAGYSMLRRMRNLRLNPADEICYRVMMQLCGAYQNPSLAVSILMEMKDCSHHPNAVTYGYYNKAVLECTWSSGPITKGQVYWNKLRNTLLAIRHFLEIKEMRLVRHQIQNGNSSTTPIPKPTESDNISRASSEESGVSQESSSNLIKEDVQEGGHSSNYDVGYSSMNENGIMALDSNGVINGGCGIAKRETLSMESDSIHKDNYDKSLNVSHLQKSQTKKGVQRALFVRSDSEDLAAGVRDYYEGSYSPPPHSSSKSRSQSVESDMTGIPPTLNSGSLEPVVEKMSGGSSFVSPMVGTPVTSNDPLGALLPITNLDKKMEGGVKVSNSFSTLNSRHLDDNVLGEPFSSTKDLISDGGSLARSSTLPRSLYEEAGKTASISPFSLKNFSKSSVTNRLKLGSTYLLNSLSPNTKTTHEVLTNIRSNVSSAATHIKTKYLETATSLNDEHSDKISLGSNDSRRASEVSATLPGVSNGDVELWSSLAGTFWEKWMGYSNTPVVSDTPKLSTICDNFEKHYGNIPRSSVHPVALAIEISSVTRCIVCDSAVYDEEIMAGWTAEDSNLNTKCAFCSKYFVPSLSVRVNDYRCISSALMFITSNIPAPRIAAKVKNENDPCLNQREGDQCLNDPNIVDDHPIIYWNLVWYFDRIGVKSHIPGFCLIAKSLSRDSMTIHPSWDCATVHNIFVKCLWDNPDIHKKYLSYLYMQYSSSVLSASPLIHSLLLDGVKSDKLVEPMRLFFEERIHCKSVKGRKRGMSMYRDILFLTCAANGCDNVNYVAFDRIYRNTLNQLRPTYQKYIFKSDEVPEEKAVICRRFFKSLIL
ncbi:DENND4 [Lepeophtheirus salmonis]|uniref:DENND4 n=1 Tax=Lepeophtheirus salmonis TaxID=72036 RepID=A0A7R8CB52_LEPSM|nr:DENND4 [Lepeophtheirus salmonis]CAF2756148.1 DENND4 [Lepeophtheirus salmonis]